MNKEFYIEMIIRKLSGELTSGEERQLQAWLDADSANQQTLADLRRTWEHADVYQSNYTPDKDLAWKKIEKKLGHKGGKIISLNQNKKWFAAAASIAVLLAFSWLLLITRNPEVMIQTAKGEKMDISLPDGSEVSLNELSSLSYHKQFRTREVELSGEAYFDVQHDTSSPFVVTAGETNTTVLGTTFNVNAYPEQKNIAVSLFTGKIEFQANEDEGLILLPGESASYISAEKTMKKFNTTDLNINSWKTGVLKFMNTPLPEVAKSIEKLFQNKIDLKLETEQVCNFTGDFENQTLDQVIEVLSYTYELKYERSNETHILTIQSCN